ncbi:hypothetical protein GQ53DRAFT_73394 [Thozetella sp. PMI_491]|nr:hypothetical protein GQ53DRAFT_73394 [Thozetella sp. PMI_491]
MFEKQATSREYENSLSVPSLWPPPVDFRLSPLFSALATGEGRRWKPAWGLSPGGGKSFPHPPVCFKGLVPPRKLAHGSCDRLLSAQLALHHNKGQRLPGISETAWASCLEFSETQSSPSQFPTYTRRQPTCLLVCDAVEDSRQTARGLLAWRPCGGPILRNRGRARR